VAYFFIDLLFFGVLFMKLALLAFLIPFSAAAPALAQSATRLCDDDFWTTASRAEITAAIATQDVSATCEFGLFPLHKAANFGTASDIAALVAGGAYVNQVSINFGSPLHVAAYGRDVATIAALVAAGADVNGQIAPNGSSPLHMAIDWGGSEAHIQALLQAGADIELEDNDGMTPLAYALKYGNPEQIKALRAAGAIEN